MMSYIAEIEQRLNEFEKNLVKSLNEAKALKRRVLDILEEVRVYSIPKKIPKKYKEPVKVIKELINNINEMLYEKRKEYVKQQKLERKFEDRFILVVGGEVKRGKSTFSNCLATFFEKGLKREVKRFVLKQPTMPIFLSDAVIGKEVYAPWANEKLGKYHEIYEQLKANGFKLNKDIIQKLKEHGINQVETGIEGEPKEEIIDAFGTDVLEATVEMQGFKSGRLVVFDSPGLGSGNRFAVKRAEEIWKMSDLGIYFTSSKGQPLSGEDVKILKQLKGTTFVIFCVNKCDTHEEDEVNGEIISEWKFDEEKFKKQKVFIERELKESGLDKVLINHKITGISSRLCTESLKNGKNIKSAIRSGRIDGILEVLSQTLSSEGVRLKEEAPKKRIKNTLNDVIEYLENGILPEFSRQKETLLRANNEIDIKKFENSLRKKLTKMVKTKIARAKNMAEQTGSVTLYIGREDILKVIEEVRRQTIKDYRLSIEKALHLIPNMRGEFEVVWQKIEENANIKVGRDKTGSAIGAAIGESIGEILGAAGGPLGAVIGAALGGVIGAAIGSLFDEDVHENFKIEKTVRVQDNFDIEEERIMREIDKIVRKTTEDLREWYNVGTQITIDYIQKMEEELNKKILQLKSIKQEVSNEF